MSKEINLNTLRDEIYKITDKDLGLTIKELNALSDIRLEENTVQIYFDLIQPIHLIAEEINKECQSIVSRLFPGIIAEVIVNEQPFDINRDILGGVKNLIVVASGKGGVGKSAISANIASALSLTGAAVGILDADVYGPSQPTMFDLKDAKIFAVEQPDGKSVAYPTERYGIKVASMGFVMKQDEAAIVRGPMLAGYFSMLFEQIEWGALDYLVFDLPPGTGDIQLTLTQKIPVTGSVIVTTPQEIAVADVRRSIAMFNRVNVDILGVIENMSYFVPPDMPDKKYYIFGEGGGKKIAEDYKVNFLGQVPLNIQMRENNDGGKPIVLADPENHQSKILREITAKIISEIRKLNYKKSIDSDLEISI
ncbi:ATP-binding protein [Bacteroidetes/Chlorobi group bacterium ChocPot_Mid]|jgi:ATP-binding protein involved in chromosome partitioning|nr:MAG: ATP-binding protein [Bacteroidetes/Chlorobi group bacterium ChocPot_Mid]